MRNKVVLIHGANAIAGITKAYLNIDQDDAVERFHQENPHSFGSLEIVEFDDELTISSISDKIQIQATHHGFGNRLRDLFE